MALESTKKKKKTYSGQRAARLLLTGPVWRRPAGPGFNWERADKDPGRLLTLNLLGWKYAYVQPVPKKGDRSNPSSYRPIALLSCLSKASESILNRKLLKHLSASDLLSDRQYGFRKGRSTDDLLAFLTDSWSSSLSRSGETFAVALDISKAFDRVWHKALL